MKHSHRPTILFVDHAPFLGGAEHSLLDIMTGLHQREWKIHLACSAGELATRATEIGVDTHILAFPRLRRSHRFLFDLIQTAHKLSQLARQCQADIVHSNTTRAAIYASLAAKLSHHPHIWHKRDFWLGESVPQHPQFDAWGKKFICGVSRKIIANSQATSARMPCSKRKIFVVHNGLQLRRYQPRTNDWTFRRQWNIPDHAPVVGMVGRLRPIKGQAQFLQMAAQVRALRPDVHFLIIGGDVFRAGDGYKQQLLKLADDLNMTDAVTFTGQIEDIPLALGAMDIFVNPGEPEAFGLVNIEAMAMEKPIVAFAYGALPEIVTPETGILVSPGDLKALSEAVLELLSHPQRAAALGRAGRERVARHFTIQQTISNIEKIYHAIMENPNPDKPEPKS